MGEMGDGSARARSRPNLDFVLPEIMARKVTASDRALRTQIMAPPTPVPIPVPIPVHIDGSQRPCKIAMMLSQRCCHNVRRPVKVATTATESNVYVCVS